MNPPIGQGSRIDRLLDEATPDELVALTSGSDLWHTMPIARLGIPAMRVSDGPVGVRGTRFDGPASINIPCSTLLAATWDPGLVEEIGELLGREAVAKGVSVHLAPAVNLHRTPIGGRNFEFMSEEPQLSARMAVAYVRGVQSTGVASCIKHFVGNDTEIERMTVDSRIDERTLREVYLVPFEAAVREAGVRAVMTAYNRVDGSFCTDHRLIAEVLRGEWGFDGVVISDWFGLHSTVEAVIAGTDLEMPGPTLHRGATLAAAIDAGEVAIDVVRARARAVLETLEWTGALDREDPGAESTRDDPDDHALVRRAAAEGMVLVRNVVRTDRPVLPLDPTTVRRVAVIGPNADRGQLMGGGSAHVTPTSASHPLDALARRLGPSGVEVAFAEGCRIHRRLPALDPRQCTEFTVEIYRSPDDLDDASVAPVRTRSVRGTRLMWQVDPTGQARPNPSFGARLRTTFTPSVSGAWQFGVECIGSVRLHVDGRMVLDTAGAPLGGSFFGNGCSEQRATVSLEEGRPTEIVLDLRHPAMGMTLAGASLGALAPVVGDPLAEAVDLAASSDLAVVVVGTNDDWESEGWDRRSLDLPGDQDELVRRVARTGTPTVVVINAGAPVAMPWLDEVDAVVVAWFPGQAFGDALVDVLVGDVEPQGRLPVTFPRRLEDTPAFEHLPPRDGVAHYAEGRLIGHRWYDTTGREPLFAFGHGLGYGQVEIVGAAAPPIDGVVHEVVVEVANRGARPAVEVVQVYAHCPTRTGGDQPVQWLVGFVKVCLAVGEVRTVAVPLDDRSFSTWDVATGSWRVVDEPHELRIGTSSRRIVARVPVVPVRR
ncbi:MAG: glycoside hydrolase family 3 protein [Ilumatobacteraceae bacterium]